MNDQKVSRQNLQLFELKNSNSDYADDLVLLTNTTAQTKSLLQSLEQAERSVDLYNLADKTEFVSFKQEGVIFTLSNKPLKLVDQITYFGRNILSTENDVNIHAGKGETTIDKLSIIWKRDHFKRFLLSYDCVGTTV